MSGGIVRAGRVFRELENGAHTHVVLVGSAVAGNERQDELKAECLGEFSRTVSAAGLELSADLARLGPGELLSLDQLSGHTVFTSSVMGTPLQHLSARIRTGPFLVGSIVSNPAQMASREQGQMVGDSDAIQDLIDRAEADGLVSVLAIDGNLQAAKRLACDHPKLDVLVYRSTSDPTDQPIKVGKTRLVTPGYHGKNIIALSFTDGVFHSYRILDLGPDVGNDKATQAVYRRYLERVSGENLLANWPRLKTPGYAGSHACASCHSKAYAVWAGSGHAHAFRDLDAQSHGMDPDCVRCHVVGLSSERGFYSVAKTPTLASVGCESCHGPGKDHVENPARVSFKRVSFNLCVACHTIENSPSFDVKKYWIKVRH
jgi:hypothetical protein